MPSVNEYFRLAQACFDSVRPVPGGSHYLIWVNGEFEISRGLYVGKDDLDFGKFSQADINKGLRRKDWDSIIRKITEYKLRGLLK